jgi:nucleotide-binding universal stress UspA family protein
MHHILLAVDESDGARRAADFVERLFEDERVSVTAVNVAAPVRRVAPACDVIFMSPWPAASRADSAAMEEALGGEEVVAGAAALLQAPEADDVRVVFGEPVSAICRLAEAEDVDLIVVGANERGWLRRLLHRSVSRAVVRRARRPVLVVR